MIETSLSEGVLKFRVIAVPRASKSEIVGEHDGALRVRIASAPVDGAANKELVKVIAKYLSVAKSDVEISSGATSRRKTVCIRGIGTTAAAAVLNRTA